MTEPEHVDPKQLRPGPIRHETLPPELLEQVKAIFDMTTWGKRERRRLVYGL